MIKRHRYMTLFLWSLRFPLGDNLWFILDKYLVSILDIKTKKSIISHVKSSVYAKQLKSTNYNV